MKRLSAIIFLLLFLSLPITAQAKDYSSKLKSTDFTQLETQDMDDTVKALVQRIAKDCGVVHSLSATTYDWDGSINLAYNTLCTYTICVNLTGFRTTAGADAFGESVEYYLVYTIAHEVRHSYQWEHQEDDTDFGRSCKQGFADYKSYDGDKESYYAQFIEADANEYAKSYADKYFGKKKK